MIRHADGVAQGVTESTGADAPTLGAVRVLALDFLDAALGWVDHALDDAMARPDRAGRFLGIARLALEVARRIRCSADEKAVRP